MSLKVEAIWKELFETVSDVWPEVSVQLRGNEAKHLRWSTKVKRIVEQAARGSCYVITELGPLVADGNWGIGNVLYGIPLKMLYIRYEAEGEITRHIIEERLERMRDVLLSREFSSFQVLNVPNLDASYGNPGNDLFNKEGLPFGTGCLSTDLLAGDGRN